MLDYSPTKTQKLLGNPDQSANPTASSPRRISGRELYIYGIHNTYGIYQKYMLCGYLMHAFGIILFLWVLVGPGSGLQILYVDRTSGIISRPNLTPYLRITAYCKI